MTGKREFKFARVSTAAVTALAEYAVLLDGVDVGRVIKVEHTYDANRHNGGPRGNARMVTRMAWRALGGPARREFGRSNYYVTRREAAETLLGDE